MDKLSYYANRLEDSRRQVVGCLSKAAKSKDEEDSAWWVAEAKLWLDTNNFWRDCLIREARRI